MSAFCQRDWTQLDEENLAIGILSKVLHPELPDEWEPKECSYIMLCVRCRCRIAEGSRFYWHKSSWLAYHPACVDAAVVRRDV